MLLHLCQLYYITRAGFLDLKNIIITIDMVSPETTVTHDGISKSGMFANINFYLSNRYSFYNAIY